MRDYTPQELAQMRSQAVSVAAAHTESGPIADVAAHVAALVREVQALQRQRAAATATAASVAADQPLPAEGR